jgi:hypothetical protein
MDVEFKLIGDLTMRQFAYLCVFGGLAYLAIIAPTGIFKIPLFFISCALGIGLAFIPVEERGLDQWIVNFLKAVYSPTQMVWKKENSLPSFFLHESVNLVKQELITLAPTSSRRQLEEYLRYQEGVQKIVDPLDIPEQEYAEKVLRLSAAMPDYQSAGSATAVAVDEPVFTYSSAPQPDDQQYVEEPEEPAEVEELEEVVKPQPIIEMPEEIIAEPTPTVPLVQETISAQPAEISPVSGTEELPSQPVPMPIPTPTPVTNVEPPKAMTPSTPQKSPASKPHSVEKKKEVQQPLRIMRERRPERDARFLAPMTPDMHSGRRFMQLLPSNGVLQLPTRRSGVVMPQQDRANIESDLRDKAQKLQQLLDQIKGSEFGQPSVVKTAPKPDENVSSLPPIPPSIPVPQPVATPSPDTSRAEELQKKLEEMQKQLEDKQALLDTISKVPTPERAVIPERRLPDIAVPTPSNSTSSAPVQGSAMGQFLSAKPNVITGVLKDPVGQTLEGVLLLIKDGKGDPVRAFKTNKLGQFITSTPLVNGNYTLEVSPMNELGLTFDIISIEAKGQVIPSLEVTGRS